jgi:hypothetical protein
MVVVMIVLQTRHLYSLPLFHERKENIMSFDEWWDGLCTDAKARGDRDLMRLAFAAGAKTSVVPPIKKFKFYAGRRKVTVSARGLDAAKAKASQVLDQRAIAAGHTPPRRGWTLSLTNQMPG